MSAVRLADPVTSEAALPLSAARPSPFRLARAPLLAGLVLALLAWWRREAVVAALLGGTLDGRLAALLLLALLAGSVVLGTCDLRRLLGRPGGAARTPLRLAARRFGANRLAVAALWTIAALYAAALLAPVLAPFDPDALDDVLRRRYLPPSLTHPFGTDEFGRDLFSRAVYGARVSLSVGLLAVVLATVIGTLYGAVSAWVGGVADNVLMRLIDVLNSFPTMFLLLMLVAVFEVDVGMMILILAFTAWQGTARFIRGEILSLKEREFVEGARAIGLPGHLVLIRHLIPSALSPVLVSAALMVSGMIFAESGMSFLGIGIRPPTPTWGNMLSQGEDALLVAWWIAFFPGVLLSVTILSFNLLADGLRDALDPKTLMRKYI
jgi:peptide/nickel transport system permease protein